MADFWDDAEPLDEDEPAPEPAQRTAPEEERPFWADAEPVRQSEPVEDEARPFWADAEPLNVTDRGPRADEEQAEQAEAGRPQPVREYGEEDSSVGGAVARGAVRGAGGVPGLVAGALAGGAMGAPLGLPGMIGGAIIGGVGGSAVTQTIYDTVRDKLGIGDDPDQVAADQAQHPWAKAIGETLPVVPTLGVGAVPAGARAAGAAIGAGIDVGTQAYQKGTANVDLTEAVLRGGILGAAGGFNKAASEAAAPLARAAGRLTGATDAQVARSIEAMTVNSGRPSERPATAATEDAQTVPEATRTQGVAAEQTPGKPGDPTEAGSGYQTVRDGPGPRDLSKEAPARGEGSPFTTSDAATDAAIKEQIGTREAPAQREQAPAPEPAPRAQPPEEVSRAGPNPPPRMTVGDQLKMEQRQRMQAQAHQQDEGMRASEAARAPEAELIKRGEPTTEAKRQAAESARIAEENAMRAERSREGGSIFARSKDEPVFQQQQQKPPPSTYTLNAGERLMAKNARLANEPYVKSAPPSWKSSFQGVFSPEFMSPASEVAAGAWKRGNGIWQGLNDKWTGKLEPHYRAIERLDPKEMPMFRDYVEQGNHYPDWKPTPELEAAAKDIWAMRKEYKEEIAKRSSEPDAVRDWNEKSLPHLYKDFEKARQSFSEVPHGSGVRGSGGSLKERSMPTYHDALTQRGLEPLHYNPLDDLKAYRTELGKHMAFQDAKAEMADRGLLKYSTPEPSKGASGQHSGPPGNRIHPEWHPVPGVTSGGRQAYMPRDSARIFNNYLGEGLRGVLPREWVDTITRAGNKLTQIELGLVNGFHFFVMGAEALHSTNKGGLSQIAAGNWKEGLKTIAKSPASGVMSYRTGQRFMSGVTGEKPWSVFDTKTTGNRLKPLSAEEHEMVKVMQESGVTPVGRSFAPDVNMTNGESIYRSVMRESFGREMREAAQKIKDNPLREVPKQTWDMLGRVLQTTSEPLFNHYIPALKLGLLAENFQRAMKQAGWDLKNPEHRAEAIRFMRKEGNYIDNALGEMNKNNTFMNRAVQDAGFMSMRSSSWFIGTAKLLGGATKSAYNLGKQATFGRDPRGAAQMFKDKLDMTSPHYDPSFTYGIVMPFGMAFISSVYQLMKTGEMPKSMEDLYAPRTGGMVPGLGGRGTVAERTILPGYHKDVLGWTHDPIGEAYNKQSAMFTTLEEQARNKDWTGTHPIVRPNASIPENIADRLKHAGQKLTPFFVRSVTDTPKKGTGLSTPERILGMRSAGTQYTDPEALGKYLGAQYRREWDAKQRMEARREHGGENPPKEPKQRAPRKPRQER